MMPDFLFLDRHSRNIAPLLVRIVILILFVRSRCICHHSLVVIVRSCYCTRRDCNNHQCRDYRHEIVVLTVLKRHFVPYLWPIAGDDDIPCLEKNHCLLMVSKATEIVVAACDSTTRFLTKRMTRKVSLTLNLVEQPRRQL